MTQEFDYIVEPDIFHDLFGHVPLLMHPAIGDYIQAYGLGGLRAQRLGVLDKLAHTARAVEIGAGQA